MSSCSTFLSALKKCAFPRARVPKTPGTRERELRNARPALQLQIGSGTQIRNAKQNWVRGSAGTLTLVCEEIYLKRNAGARRATAKCRSAGMRHAKGLQELAPSSGNFPPTPPFTTTHALSISHTYITRRKYIYSNFQERFFVFVFASELLMSF